MNQKGLCRIFLLHAFLVGPLIFFLQCKKKQETPPSDLIGDGVKSKRAAALKSESPPSRDHGKDTLDSSSGRTTTGKKAVDSVKQDLPETRPAMKPKVRWSFFPDHLEVMRNTKVELEAKIENKRMGRRYECLWDMGDGSPLLSGCSLTHLFKGGMTDRIIKLTVLEEGKPIFTQSRTLALERLPVVPLKTGSNRLPAAPVEPGVRLMVMAWFAPPNSADTKRLAKAVSVVNPGFVVLFLNPGPSPADYSSPLIAFEKLSAKPVVVLPCLKGFVLPAQTMSRMSAFLEHLAILHGPNQDVPNRFAFALGSNVFIVINSVLSGFGPAQEKWLLRQLEHGRIFRSRTVFSCYPLSELPPQSRGIMPAPFRLYEKLLRGDASLYLSSIYSVYYHGRFGVLETVSAGTALGPEPTLDGNLKQPRLAVVIDYTQTKGFLVYPVEVEKPDMTWNEDPLPIRLGDYTKYY